MKFTLNTLGAPAWSLEDAARNARAYGYAGVDLRLIDGEVISLESVRANRDRLQKYVVNLAAERERDLQVMDREAQRCRGTFMAPAPPEKTSGRKK